MISRHQQHITECHRQVFWLPDLPTCRPSQSFPPVAQSASVPGYSGGPAPESAFTPHGIPYYASRHLDSFFLPQDDKLCQTLILIISCYRNVRSRNDQMLKPIGSKRSQNNIPNPASGKRPSTRSGRAGFFDVTWNCKAEGPTRTPHHP